MRPEIFVGILIGIITGIVAVILLDALHRLSLRKLSSILSLTGEFLAIPTFMFGGPWVSTTLIKIIKDFDGGSYFISLAITFGVIVIYPTFRFVVRLGEELGKEAR